MGENSYTYAVSRIRAKEVSLLDKADIEQLLSASGYEECCHLLADKGFESPERERAKIWTLMRELVDDLHPFAVFMIPYDYHNVKAAIKMVYTDDIHAEYLIPYGLMDSQEILQAVKDQDFSRLPEPMATAGQAAFKALLHTRNGQLCDVILDKAALEAVYAAGKQAKEEFLIQYAELTVACADMRVAVRGSKTGKSREWIREALVSCDSLNIDSLADAAAVGVQEIADYLSFTVYSDGAEVLTRSFDEFEKWCDNRLQEQVRHERHNAFTIAPLAAYILARESEIRAVRLILAGKRNQLSESAIRARLREIG